jgi:hypothetical protein
VGLVASAVGTDLDRIGTLFDTPRRLTDAVITLPIGRRVPRRNPTGAEAFCVAGPEGADTCSDKSA